MKKQFDMDMCNGPVAKKVILFAVPLMVSGILQLLFNAADVMVVGNYCGSDSMAAVGSNGAIINLIVNLFLGISVGTNVLVARSWGRQHADSVFRAVHSSIAISLLIGVISGASGALLAPALLRMTAVPDDILPLATLYLRIYFLGVPATVVYNFGAAILRAIGDTRHPLYYLTGAGVLNVACNLIFVCVCKLDVAGVAIASALSQYLAAFLVLRCLMRLENACRLSFRMLRIYGRETREMFRIGIPAGLQSTIFSISNVMIQAAVNGFGSTVIAGNVAAGNIDSIVYIAMNAFHHAAVSFVSQNIGAGKIRRLPRVAASCILIGGAVGLTLSCVFYLLGEPLLSVYNREPGVIAAGMIRMRWVCLPYVLCGVMDVACGVVRGMGRSWLPMIVSTVGACGLRIVWLATVFTSQPTLEILYLSYPFTWAVTAAAHIVCIWCIYNRLKQRHRPVQTQMPAFKLRASA